MNKITKFPHEKKDHIYKLEQCAGCHRDIKDGEAITEVSLPYEKKVEHIALCDECADVSREHGVNV